MADEMRIIREIGRMQEFYARSDTPLASRAEMARRLSDAWERLAEMHSKESRK